MNAAATPAAAVFAPAARATATTSVPWYLYAAVLGALCIPVGVLWDISWHITIGRDTFWTPAHILIQLGGLIPALVCGWLAFKTQFRGTAVERAAAVSLLGLRAPLGAWVVMWGCAMMVFSAPFDNWWHDAYGLDVEILSPPHAVLAVGMEGIAAGVLLLMLSTQNRLGEASAGKWLFITMVGIMLTMASVFLTELSYPNQQRNAGFYVASCLAYPLYLVTAARGSKLSWPATTAAGIYMAIWAVTEWVLPLFAASPKLGPIYHSVDHYVRLPFPLLLVVPAFALDLLIKRLGRTPGWWRDTWLAVVLGLAFFLVLHATQWSFSGFLVSPAANNWFFGGGAERLCPYFGNAGSHWNEFWNERGAVLPFPLIHASGEAWRAALRAVLFGAISARVGLAFGAWMSRVRR